MNERELVREVVTLLEARPSLRWHLCGDSRHCRGPRGWPDLAVIGRQLLLRELKGDETRTRMHQLEYGDALMATGARWGIWRPSDLQSGRIAGELDALC